MASELPEAEFGMQHAYALIRRLQRQGIEFGLVLATEPVADDAYQYLSDRVARNQGPMVSVLEGSQAINDEFADAINEWSIISVRMLGEELIDTTGVDFGAIIEEWMRRQLDNDEPEELPEIDLSDLHTDATITTLPRIASSGGSSAG